MKRKIGIITIIGKNYGNRLQNYALQEVLQNYAKHVYTIPMYKEPVIKQKIKYYIERIIHRNVVKQDGWMRFYFLIKWESDSIRELCEEQYDAFVAGSDQIWNPFFEYNTEREFLTFAKKKKRITYAASMGIEVLPDSCKDRYREWLSEIPFISVRESVAANIVYELIGKKVPVVLDPVFLLNEREWNKLAKKANCSEKSGYIFYYFLGKHNEEANNWIEKLANQRGLRVLNILEHFDEYGPMEFVALIKGAEMVVTNSFHCTAFSIIYHKQFVVFERQMDNVSERMTSRLNTLLEMFDLKNRFYSEIGSEDISKIEDIKWKEIDRVLKERRDESIKFITEALNVNG